MTASFTVRSKEDELIVLFDGHFVVRLNGLAVHVGRDFVEELAARLAALLEVSKV